MYVSKMPMTRALGSAEDPCRSAESHPKLTWVISAQERALLGLKRTHLYRQRTLSGGQRTF